MIFWWIGGILVALLGFLMAARLPQSAPTEEGHCYYCKKRLK